jgi:hypothetical protein
MKTNSILAKVKTYLKELTIVTAGVLIALLISNHKENSQARDYYKASVETVKNEVQANYTSLKSIIEKQIELIDTINKYSADKITISDLIIEKGGGIQSATLSNSGLEFYKNNQINSIDFEMMSRLINIESTSKLIDTKMEKLMDYLYPNLFVDSEESKKLVFLHMKNLLNSEIQLRQAYEEFINEYVENKNDTK